MLCLTRRLGERVWIGDEIIIEVTRAEDGRVQLGIIAPTHIRVDREEVRRKRLAA